MHNNKKLQNHIQNILIGALCITSILLLCNAAVSNFGGVFGGFKGFTKSSDVAATVTVSDAKEDAAQPLYMLVTAETGAHYAAKYDDERQRLLTLFSSTVGEALGSASSKESISEETFRTAASGTGIFLDFVFDQSMDFIAQGLGAVCSKTIADELSSRLMLSVFGNELYLYFTVEETFYRCHTACNVGAFLDKVADCPIGMAQFAFEQGTSYARLDPYFIFTNETVVVPDVGAANPVTDTLAGRELLGCFGINYSTYNNYPESDGSTVYVDGNLSLRFGIDGELIFSVSGTGGIDILSAEEMPDTAEIITACSKITNSIFSYFNIDPTLCLTQLTQATGADCELAFAQLIHGIPAKVSGSFDTAKFTVTAGRVTEIEIMLRRYELSTVGSSSPMPEKQTAAIVGVDGGEPVLVYVDEPGANPVISWSRVS